MAIIIYASELAACVGMNKYKCVEDAKMEVWRRWDAPSLHLALTGDSLIKKTPEEIYSSLDPSVKKLVSQAVFAGTENAATAVVEAALNEKANTVTPETIEAIASAASRNETVDAACETLVGSRDIAEKLNNIPAFSTADARRVIDSVKIKDVPELANSVVREVNTLRGTKNEDAGIASYERSKRVKLHGKNSTFYKKFIGKNSFGTSVYVGGRVDGLTDDKVVEVKCRRNHLFNTLPVYEKVQTQAYLFLTGKHTVEVVQKYDARTRSDEYVADPHFWNQVCEAALAFASDLEKSAEACRVEPDEDGLDVILQTRPSET